MCYCKTDLCNSESVLPKGLTISLTRFPSVKCYICSTLYSPACGDPFDPSGNGVHEQRCHDGACITAFMVTPGKSEFYRQLFFYSLNDNSLLSIQSV